MKLDYSALGVSAPVSGPLNDDTSYHRFNREASRRRVYALIAWGVVVVAVAGVVIVWRFI